MDPPKRQAPPRAEAPWAETGTASTRWTTI